MEEEMDPDEFMEVDEISGDESMDPEVLKNSLTDESNVNEPNFGNDLASKTPSNNENADLELHPQSSKSDGNVDSSHSTSGSQPKQSKCDEKSSESFHIRSRSQSRRSHSRSKKSRSPSRPPHSASKKTGSGTRRRSRSRTKRTSSHSKSLKSRSKRSKSRSRGSRSKSRSRKSRSKSRSRRSPSKSRRLKRSRSQSKSGEPKTAPISPPDSCSNSGVSLSKNDLPQKQEDIDNKKIDLSIPVQDDDKEKISSTLKKEQNNVKEKSPRRKSSKSEGNRKRSERRKSRRSRSRSRSRSKRSKKHSRRRKRHHSTSSSSSSSSSSSKSRSQSPKSTRLPAQKRQRTHSPMSDRKRHLGSKDNLPPSNSIVIFGLPLTFRDTDLVNLIPSTNSTLSPTSASIIMEKQSGISRGFGFMNYNSEETAASALNFLQSECEFTANSSGITCKFSITHRAHSPTPNYYLGCKKTMKSLCDNLQPTVSQK